MGRSASKNTAASSLTFSLHKTLRIVALIIVVLMSPAILFTKARLPTSGPQTTPILNLSFTKTMFFWTIQISNIIQALGYFLPINYLPSIAESIGLRGSVGSMTILCVNGAAIFGCVGVGALVDKFDVTSVLLAQSLLSCIAILVILGLTSSITPLFVFSCFYGLTAAAYTTTWGGVIRQIQQKHADTDANLIFGALALGRGVGSVISGPLSDVLLGKPQATQDTTTTVYASQYGRIIIFSGCTAVLGGISWVVKLKRSV